MLNQVKLALRISNDVFDDEITSIIEAAKLDLTVGGVELTDTSDPLIKRAIILYAKANYGLSNPDSDKYDDAYHNLREKLAISGLHTIE